MIKLSTLVTLLGVTLLLGCASTPPEPNIFKGLPSFADEKAWPRQLHRQVMMSSLVDFQEGHAEVSELAKEELTDTIEHLGTLDVDTIAITVFSYTANPKEHEALSLARAQNIKEFLTLLGIAPDRIRLRAGDHSQGGRNGLVILNIEVAKSKLSSEQLVLWSRPMSAFSQPKNRTKDIP